VASDAEVLDETEVDLGGTKPKKVDIDKMHAYRDSIRDVWDNRIVSYAAILYPGKTVEFGSGLAAISTRPFDLDFAAAMRAILTGQLFGPFLEKVRVRSDHAGETRS